MKNNRITGILYFLFTMVSHGFSQGTIDLNIKMPDSACESATLVRKLKLTNPFHSKYSDLNPKIEQIIGFFENSGYPFVQVRLDSVLATKDGINGILVIRPGELVTIDTIMNRTGFHLSLPVLYRLMNLRPGDRYHELIIKEANARLGQLTYLHQVRSLEVGFHPGKASVYLYPEKSGSNRFDGWVGLSPDLRAGSKLAFSGALALNLNNIIGQGENWLFDWQRNQDGSQRLNLAAHIPYFAGLPLGLQGKFELYRQDTSYLNVSWDVGIPYHFSPRNLLNVFLRHKESSIVNSIPDSKSSLRQPFTSLLSGISWEYDHLDNPISPYKGLKLEIEASTGRKSIPDSSSMQQSEFIANVSWFKPIAKNLTCALEIQSGYRKSPATYENEQYRLGGLNLLRGFDEDFFHTDAYAVTSVELRYLLDRSSYLIILADLGFLNQPTNNVNVLKTPAGFGLGGQIRTAGGIFKIIFAIGKESGLPVNLKNSKIHLGYVGVF